MRLLVCTASSSAYAFDRGSLPNGIAASKEKLDAWARGLRRSAPLSGAAEMQSSMPDPQAAPRGRVCDGWIYRMMFVGFPVTCAAESMVGAKSA